MSVILGLHFGHDASVAVVVDGRLAAFVQRERLCRIKQAYSLDRATVEVALDRAGLPVQAIDVVAVTSTQGCEPILSKFDDFSMSYDASMAVGRPSLLIQSLGSDPVAIERQCAPSMVKRALGTPRDPSTHPAFQHYFAEYSAIPYHELRRFPWFDTHVDLEDWREPKGLDAVVGININDRASDERCQLGFHYPVRITMDGHSLPGLRLDHHLAHAASTYYRSGAHQALILTNDGYGGRRTSFSNGGIYLGLENYLIALGPHFLTHGNLYDYVARSIGLSAVGASGKLMGLAAYGSPDYFDHRFIGDAYDHARSGINGSAKGWLAFAQDRSRALGHKENGIINTQLPFSEFQINLAASTQLLFESIWLALVNATRRMLENDSFHVNTLCLSGGAALNCPSNSRICREGGFQKVFIEPNCDDSGLSIGAAFWTYHALLGHRLERINSFAYSEAYTHEYSRDQILAAINTNKEILHVEETYDAAETAANDLAAGRLVAWFEGGSEMGPRALGHRSVLADPRPRSALYRMNQAKGREMWRPFAPAVLEEYAENYFDFSNLPRSSPFMLLNMQVLDSSLAAVTHVDGSARVQTVTIENGRFYFLLHAFNRRVGIPVILNTSMNGLGEPIVETPDQAIAFLLLGGADVLYLENFRLIRNHGSSSVSPS